MSSASGAPRSAALWEVGVTLGVPNAVIFSSPDVEEPTAAELPCLRKHPDSAQGY